MFNLSLRPPKFQCTQNANWSSSCLQASQPDELTIEEQEILEVIDDGDMEDWVKVRKHTHMFIRVPFMSFMWFVLLKCCVPSHVFVIIFHFYVAFVITQVIVSVCVARLAIRRDRWATSPRNTCSSPPPTVC